MENGKRKPSEQERREASIDASTRQIMDQQGCSYEEARAAAEWFYSLSADELRIIHEDNES